MATASVDRREHEQQFRAMSEDTRVKHPDWLSWGERYLEGTCGYCGKPILLSVREIRHRKVVYCSRRCARRGLYRERAAKLKPTLTCARCGKSYTPERRSSRFCSGTCRQAAYRERARGAIDGPRGAVAALA
jgi:endogenous inhibitor of DNA gyrase (YacG/DUF329 family)